MSEANQERRTMLKLIGAGAVALVLPEHLLKSGPSPYRAKIGLQIYTVRKALESDFEGTIRKVADIGFFGIESYPLPANVTIERAARVFKDAGLTVFAMHTDWPVAGERDDVLKMADMYRCNRVVYPGWPEGEKYRKREAIRHMADVYNEAGSFLHSRGLRFGLHNHWWEFELRDGIYPFYYFLEHLDRTIFFEVDTYWAKTGGKDPAKVVKDFGARAPLLHIKDGPAVKGDLMLKHVPAGEGTLDFPGIVRAGGRNTEWMIVEFDEYEKDIFDGIQASYTFLTGHGLASGRL